uniref:Protein yellow n=2 Tax=Drosophila melanogaster TaxID=7227 RepID=YELL_DROME|nr:yellow [Drosophila melanogaster]P09957.1 RecName: Full=Protein yellow; Flags: Precursor [Drosophila melanogaster]AAM54038.1 yellow protein [P-element transformation vector pP{wHy}]WOT18130.1 yellow [Cloning and transformation vector pHACKy-GAL4_nlsLexA::GADfl]prf//1303224A yellow gene [Drosophila sp. (in: flies)]AAF45497.1 yellow [Drosophila melanogaster]QCT24307.1 yellow [Drosophila melanogaster]|eukprot:NP_476792.1 yellow [Drosophila melanogaster]
MFQDKGWILVTLITLVTPSWAAYKLQERYSWSQLDFAFPNTRLKDQALASGDYIPQNALPVGVEHFGNRLFVTVPRWRDGIPATLTYINMDRSLTGSPELIPYPDWRSNTAGDCANSITTAYRIKVDECGRLWVLDTGTVGIGNTTTNPCPYAVNVFDLTTDTRIRRYELPGVDTNPNTFIANIAVDIGKNCDDAYAYFADELGYGLIAYSWELNKSWRFSAHSYFFPDPLRGDFNVAGINFQWGEEGIFGMSLSPIRSDGYRTLYFSPLASHRQFAVSTRILRDETRTEDSYHDFVALDERGPNSHTTSRVMSDDGIELFNLIDQNAVGCWHSSMPYSPQFHGIVDRDDVGLVFPADVKIDENKNVWVLSDRMPVFLLSDLDYSDTNFRIYTAPLATLIENTVCDLRNNAYGPPNTVSIPKQAVLPMGPPLYTKQYRPVLPQKPQTSWASSPPPPSRTYLPANSGNVVSSISVSTNSVGPAGVEVPKAYIFNQHNGINYETSGPHLFPTHQPAQPGGQDGGLKTYVNARQSGWWHHQHQG